MRLPKKGVHPQRWEKGGGIDMDDKYTCEFCDGKQFEISLLNEYVECCKCGRTFSLRQMTHFELLANDRGGEISESLKSTGEGKE